MELLSAELAEGSTPPGELSSEDARALRKTVSVLIKFNPDIMQKVEKKFANFNAPLCESSRFTTVILRTDEGDEMLPHFRIELNHAEPLISFAELFWIYVSIRVNYYSNRPNIHRTKKIFDPSYNYYSGKPTIRLLSDDTILFAMDEY
ncbi:MAG: hypothetical protein M0R33_15295 [Methylomonas sp.]|uniref:hypothetical protein n=1 Tax=Methylomonas sp. TaxID=418 RepID=UPI0025F47F7E|nr:hypothetical protein [Methylomonas sp.]MCK9607807.1 hypothetical protein [Methylomonas sp.]